jgi:serine phosphatase RsbU (regulator of sigma subunit)
MMSDQNDFQQTIHWLGTYATSTLRRENALVQLYPRLREAFGASGLAICFRQGSDLCPGLGFEGSPLPSWSGNWPILPESDPVPWQLAPSDLKQWLEGGLSPTYGTRYLLRPGGPGQESGLLVVDDPTLDHDRMRLLSTCFGMVLTILEMSETARSNNLEQLRGLFQRELLLSQSPALFRLQSMASLEQSLADNLLQLLEARAVFVQKRDTAGLWTSAAVAPAGIAPHEPGTIGSQRIDQREQSLLTVHIQDTTGCERLLVARGKDSRGKPISLDMEDRRLMQSFGELARAALDNHHRMDQAVEHQLLQQELKAARAIQERIVPRGERLPCPEGWDIWGQSVPCRDVGGDYFDVFPLADGRLAVLMCDVAGKGLSAALLVSTLQAAAQALLHSGLALDRVASEINRILLGNTDDDQFATGFIALLDPISGMLEYVNAAHNPPLLSNGTGLCQELTDGGLPLGMFEGSRYTVGRQYIPPGATLLLYTDGLTEGLDHEQRENGTDFLYQALEAPRTGSRQLTDTLIARLRTWTATPADSSFTHDDVTVLVVGRRTS